jgi:hypothetical protein
LDTGDTPAPADGYFIACWWRQQGDLYSCKADGSNVTKIVDKGSPNNNIVLGGAY